jgi:hypothetical protein
LTHVKKLKKNNNNNKKIDEAEQGYLGSEMLSVTYRTTVNEILILK